MFSVLSWHERNASEATIFVLHSGRPTRKRRRVRLFRADIHDTGLRGHRGGGQQAEPARVHAVRACDRGRVHCAGSSQDGLVGDFPGRIGADHSRG